MQIADVKSRKSSEPERGSAKEERRIRSSLTQRWDDFYSPHPNHGRRSALAAASVADDWLLVVSMRRQRRSTEPMQKCQIVVSTWPRFASA